MNRKDWLKIAGLLGLGATGFGLAGMGPLAGILGGATSGAAAGAAGAAGAGAAGSAASLSAVPALETAAMASQVPWHTQALATAKPLLDSAASGAATAQKIAAPMQMAGLLGGGQPPPPMPAPPMPQMAPPPPQDSNYGYPAPGGGGMKPPNIPQHVWDSLDPATKQKLLMGGMS